MHTNKERDAINSAYHEIVYAAECCDWKAPQMLREALKMEKRERSSVTTAKALQVRCFYEGWKAPKSINAQGLYAMAQGCIMATIAGAGLRGRLDRIHRDGRANRAYPDLRKLRAAIAAHDAALERYCSRSKLETALAGE